MKKKLIGFLSSVMALSLLAGCGTGGNASGNNGGASGAKDNLVVAITGAPRSLDPFSSNDNISTTVQGQLYDTLFVQNEKYEVVPSLVDQYSWVDDTTLNLTVKAGVKFSDGSDLTVNDVLFTINRAIDSEYLTWIVENIDLANTKILDDGKTLEIKLKNPKADQLAAFGFLYIVSEKAVTTEGYDPETAPIGSGPFKFSMQVKGDRIELVKNDGYWNGVPKYTTLIFRIITEAASRTIEVESGGVDIIYNVLPTDIPTLESSAGVVIHRAPNFSLNFVGFNCTREPFNNPKVRQAITYAVDKAALVDAVYGQTGSVATGPISSVIWGYSDDVMQYTYDVEKAKALLAEAGFPDGFATTMTISDSQQRVDTAEILQNQLKDIGITMEVQVLENATYLDKIVANDFDMFALGWTTTTGDADYGMYETFYTGMPTWSNTTQYSNPKLDQYLDAGRATVDPEARKAAYAEAQKILVEEAPEIYLWNGEEILAARDNVKGLVLSPSGRHTFETVYFE